MAMETVTVPLDPAAYVNVANGQTACAIFINNDARIRLVVQPAQPAVDHADWVYLKPRTNQLGLALTMRDLAATDGVWLLTEKAGASVLIMRGDAKPNFAE